MRSIDRSDATGATRRIEVAVEPGSGEIAFDSRRIGEFDPRLGGTPIALRGLVFDARADDRIELLARGVRLAEAALMSVESADPALPVAASALEREALAGLEAGEHELRLELVPGSGGPSRSLAVWRQLVGRRLARARADEARLVPLGGTGRYPGIEALTDGRNAYGLGRPWHSWTSGAGRSRTSAAPPPALRRNQDFVILEGVIGFSIFAMYIAQPLTPNFLTGVRGLSLSQTGLIFTAGALGNSLMAIFFSRAEPRRGFILSQMLVALFAMCIWKGSSLPVFALGYFLLGGFRASRPMALAQVRELVHDSQMGVTYGVIETISSIKKDRL